MRFELPFEEKKKERKGKGGEDLNVFFFGLFENWEFLMIRRVCLKMCDCYCYCYC